MRHPHLLVRIARQRSDLINAPAAPRLVPWRCTQTTKNTTSAALLLQLAAIPQVILSATTLTMGNGGHQRMKNTGVDEAVVNTVSTPQSAEDENAGTTDHPRPGEEPWRPELVDMNRIDHRMTVEETIHSVSPTFDDEEKGVAESPGRSLVKDPTNTPQEPAASPKSSAKCGLCSKRMSREGCTRQACLQCCSDDNCESHRKSKENAIWKQQVLSGTTDVQNMVNAIRKKTIRKGRFREIGFRYQGDTVIIWDLREYRRNSKWKEDAMRKSARRSAREEQVTSDGLQPFRSLGSRRKRFHRLIEEHYKRSAGSGK